MHQGVIGSGIGSGKWRLALVSFPRHSRIFFSFISHVNSLGQYCSVNFEDAIFFSQLPLHVSDIILIRPELFTCYLCSKIRRNVVFRSELPEEPGCQCILITCMIEKLFEVCLFFYVVM